MSVAVVGLALFVAQPLARAADLEPVGTWLTEDGRAKIRTEKCGDGNANLCGYVVWLKDPLDDKGLVRTDIKNPDPAKRNRSSIGLELMDGLKSEDDPSHYTGQIYNAENGKMYDVTLAIEDADELHIKGCMLKYLCGSQTWTKVADLPIPSSKQMVQNTAKKPAAHKADAPAK